MKIRTYGDSDRVVLSWWFFIEPTPSKEQRNRLKAGDLKKDEFLAWKWGPALDGCISYKKERSTGVEMDSPAMPFPNDGVYTWGPSDKAGDHIRYTEGTGDRAWMEERDRNYILRLAREGRLLELEPNANREITADHHYRDEITRVLSEVLNEAKERTKKEAKNQEDKVRQAVAETKNHAESVIALIKTLKEQLKEQGDTATSVVTEMETLIEIYTAMAVNAKKQADIDLTVKLKLQLKDAAPMIDVVKKQAAETLPLEEEIKKQVKTAHDILQKAEEIRQANPIAVSEIAAQAVLAGATLAEVKKLNGTAAKILEKAKENIARVQKTLAQTQDEIVRQRRVLADEKAKGAAGDSEVKNSMAERPPEKPAEFSLSLQLIPYQTLTYGKKELGHGGFGRVYPGEWQYTEVAIKELLASNLSEVAMSEFRRETEIWGKLRHPNIVQLFGISVDESAHYSMVMELMPNGSLYQVLHNGKPLNWEIRFHIARDIAAGLTHLHEQEILHCDLKSMNVLLGEGMHAKLTDFGLSKVKVETKMTTGGAAKISGTIRWMAPELFKRGEHASKASDVYSFGMILWELASRKIPYEETDDDAIAKDWIRDGEKEKITEDCQRTYPSYASLIARCWEKRSRRPTIQESAEVLRPLKATEEAPPAPLASGPVHQDNFASVVPK